MIAWCEQQKDRQLALLKELAAIPAPSHHEEQRVAFIKGWLEEQGAKQVLVDEAKNVILTFGEGPYTVFMAHTDVVFPDETPLPVREEDGKLYAPGVGDDTANVVALMLCAQYLLEHPEAAKGSLLLVFNSCEEGLGNLKGVRQICKDYEGKIRRLVSFDGTMDGLVDRAVGSERWKVTAKTKGGHSYGNFGNPNAIAALSGIICCLYGQPVPKKEGTKTTYNVGTVSGGTSVNTIAQSAEMLYEYRSDDRECMDRMRQQFTSLLWQLDSSDARFEKELLGERPCGGEVDQEAFNGLLDKCSALVEKHTGKAPDRHSSSTDCNIPLSLGLPATCFGLYRGKGAHTREEFVEIDSLNPGLKLGLDTVLTLSE
ncbi:MAG: M20/M25/M40 family metallo-hydrolase [Clostridia bacterium]|nr:M20/M25/M40 family metallo-hydrolase [Clostridia bacterium]